MTGVATSAKRPVLPPPFPAVALQLIRQMQQPQLNAGEVAKLIQLDPSLTASLLRLVNSPFFGMRREIANVSDAVMVLGMGAVRRMVLSLAVAVPLRRLQLDAAFVRAQWQHTVSCAALARRLIVDDPALADLAFTAGLLHDIGEVQLLQLHGADYAELLAAYPAQDLRAIERERFGEAHDTLGAELLEGWGLPQAIVDAARRHHAAPPIAPLSTVQQAVWIANLLAGAPDALAQANLLCPDTLAPVARAVQEARAEIDALADLLNGSS